VCCQVVKYSKDINKKKQIIKKNMRHIDHLIIDRLFLGKEFHFIHDLLDSPRLLFGKKHRKVNHNKEFLNLIYLLYGEEAYYSALLHVIFDGVKL